MNKEEQQMRVTTACQAAEEFTKLYFESFDQKRSVMNKFYMNEATFSWDGNPAAGKQAIQKFLDELPQTTHTLIALDAQPVYFEAVKGQQAILVQVGGFITFIKEKKMKGFSQSFLISAQDNKWKIVNDSCRLQCPINESYTIPTTGATQSQVRPNFIIYTTNISNKKYQTASDKILKVCDNLNVWVNCFLF